MKYKDPHPSPELIRMGELVGLDMSKYYTHKYNADFYLVRNGLRFRRCTESGELIWPFQKAYRGLEKLRWPLDVYWLKPDQYLILKIQDKVA